MSQSSGSDERDRLANLLQYQLQQCLNQTCPGYFRVCTYEVIDESSALKPAISVLKDSGDGFRVCWVVDLLDAQDATVEQSNLRSELYARLAIADYWSLIPSQADLRTYSAPMASPTISPVYQVRHLLHVGEQASPTAIPSIVLSVQEPMPLRFLTRTLQGHRTHAATTPPLQVISSTTFQRAV